ncbi:protein TBATA [Rhynchocyon petersi]
MPDAAPSAAHILPTPELCLFPVPTVLPAAQLAAPSFRSCPRPFHAPHIGTTCLDPGADTLQPARLHLPQSSPTPSVTADSGSPCRRSRLSRDWRSAADSAPPRPEMAPAAPAPRSERSACAAQLRARARPHQRPRSKLPVWAAVCARLLLARREGAGALKAYCPKAELRTEKKPVTRLQRHGDTRPQKELVSPGIMDFKLNEEAVKIPKLRTPGAYRFGRLSHHSFFSRHHPHPQLVTHIPDLTGNPVCVVRDEFLLNPLPPESLLPQCLMGTSTISAPVGDPQSNRDPQLSSAAWKKELKDLASRVAIFTKEMEMKNKEEKEELQREQGAKYSAQTGRLIPASTRRSSRHSQRSHTAGRDAGARTTTLQNQELLTWGASGWGERWGSRNPYTKKQGVWDSILDLLSQILQTDSLSAIQSWLLSAPQKEKDLVLGLLQTAVAQMLPRPLTSIPADDLLIQLQEVQELSQEKQQPFYSQSRKKMKTPPILKSEKPEHIGTAQVLRVHSSQKPEEKAFDSNAES